MSQSLFGEADADAHGPVQAATAGEELVRLGRQLPEQVHLGTSSWNFPGWSGLIYDREYPESRLMREGLAAYSRHPLLRAAGIERGVQQALDAGEWTRLARQVHERFRFVVRAPAAVTDALIRHPGQAGAANPRFLDATYAVEHFVSPVVEGLGQKAGPLVLQWEPMPARSTRDTHESIERIAQFLARLPAQHAGTRLVYAVELRNPELLTPRFVHRMREVGARLCIGIHPRMPAAARQAAALRTLDAHDQPGPEWTLTGPLIARWSLHAGCSDEQAKLRYAPFDRLIDSDVVTRGTLVHLIRVAVRSRQPAYVIVNNKAEGCAPLSCLELARALVDRAQRA